MTTVYKQTVIYININNLNRADEIDIRNNNYISSFNNLNKIFNDIILKFKKRKDNYTQNLEILQKVLLIILNKKYNLTDNIFNYVLTTIVKNIDKCNKLLKIHTNINSGDFDDNYESITFLKTNLLI